MENNGEIPNDKKCVNRAKSFNSPPSVKLKTEPTKRKSFNVNEAVKSLDLALGRLKKSKLVNGECRQMSSVMQEASEMCMDMCNSNQPSTQGIDNASLMSMNFSHYELMRNLSRSNCNSEGAFSDNTSCVANTAPDMNVKDEHLERYFRSIEMWTRNYKEGGPSTLSFEMPDQ